MKLDEAIELSKLIAENSNMKYKLGAVLFDNKHSVAGFNRKFDVCCKNRINEFSMHAEEMCIIKANKISDFDFKNSTLVVVRINNSGKFMRSFPCSHCQKLINQFNISTIHFVP